MAKMLTKCVLLLQKFKHKCTTIHELSVKISVMRQFKITGIAMLGILI